jgi:hypothetical protein
MWSGFWFQILFNCAETELNGNSKNPTMIANY